MLYYRYRGENLDKNIGIEDRLAVHRLEGMDRHGDRKIKRLSAWHSLLMIVVSSHNGVEIGRSARTSGRERRESSLGVAAPVSTKAWAGPVSKTEPAGRRTAYPSGLNGRLSVQMAKTVARIRAPA